jgi:hypothetical protein
MVNTIEGSRTQYSLEEYLAIIQFWNQKNNSCELIQTFFISENDS